MAEDKWQTIDAHCQVNLRCEIARSANGTKILQGKFGGKLVAIKKIPQHLKPLYEQEVKLFRQEDFSHPNLVTYHQCYQLKDSFYIVMELCHCNLTQYVERFQTGMMITRRQMSDEVNMETKLSMLFQTTQGLDYLHSKTIIHRDMKPDNILLNRPDAQGKVRIKLADYGISRQMENETHYTTTGLGTLMWAAPEIFGGKNQLTVKSDIFSLGAVFYYLLSWGRYAFPDMNSWLRNKPQLDIEILPINSLRRQLIENLIDRDPKTRPCTDFILKHPFFWSEQTVLDFIINVSKALENGQTTLHSSIESKISVSLITLNNDWTKEIDSTILNELNKKRGKKNQMKGSSVVDLLRAIRNKAIHYDALTPLEKSYFGSFPKGFHDYWTCRFPTLVLLLWEYVGSHSISDHLQQFYQRNTETDITQVALRLKFIESITLGHIREKKDVLKAMTTGEVRDWSSKDVSRGILQWIPENGKYADIYTENEQGLLHFAAQWDLEYERLVDRVLQKDGIRNVNDIDIEGNSPLHVAALHNREKAARKLIANGAEVNSKNFKGLTPLHLCCSRNCRETINYLLELNPEINAKDQNEETPLHVCAKEDCSAIAELLINAEAEVNATNSLGQTALHLCSEKDAVQVAKLLLDNGGDPNALDRKGETALHYCSRKNSFKVGQLLLQYSVNVDTQNIWGKTALHLSCICRHKETALLLAHEGTAVRIVDQQGRLPLHYCAINDCKDIAEHLSYTGAEYDSTDGYGWTPIHFCSMNDSYKMAKFLFQKGINRKLVDKEGETWLHIACWFNSTKVVFQGLPHATEEPLLEVKSVNKNQHSPLHHCATKNGKEIAQFLIANGADVDAMNDDHDTPLLLCGKHKSEDVAKILIDNGCDVNRFSQQRDSPLHLFTYANSKEIVRTLIDKGSDIEFPNMLDGTPLHICAKLDFKEIARNLVDKGANVDAVNHIHETPLHYCARNNSKEIAQMLISKGANVNANAVGDYTPLHTCTSFNWGDIAQLLIENGANVNVTSRELESPLHICTIWDRKEIAQSLINNGANMNTKNKDGNTPLHMCAEMNSIQTAMLLVDKGTSINILNNDNATPLHICAKFNREEIAKILIHQEANLNATNLSGDTPLHVCVKHNSIQTAHILITRGANVNVINNENETPANICLKLNRTEIAQIIAEKETEQNSNEVNETNESNS